LTRRRAFTFPNLASAPRNFKAACDVIFWNNLSWGSQAMKPKSPCEIRERRFPQTDYFFHSDMGGWRGYWSAPGDEGESAQRRFYDFTREFLLESERERAKEMFVFALVVLAAAWPVGYMVVTVVTLLLKGHPLD
jgi:hypothetical protein